MIQMGDIIRWIIIGLAMLIPIGMVVYSLCYMIRLSDEISEAEWEEFCRLHEGEDDGGAQ